MSGLRIGLLALSAFGISAVAWPAVADTQTAVANGECSVAANNNGSGSQTIKIDCLPKKFQKAVEAKLNAAEAKLNAAEAELKAHDEKINELTKNHEELKRKFDQYIAAVQTIANQAAQPSATEAQKHAAELLSQGNTSAAIQLLGEQADQRRGVSIQSAEDAVALYRQQAALQRLEDVTAARATLEKALALAPDDFNLLWDAGDIAVETGVTAMALVHYRSMQLAAQAALKQAPNDAKRQRDLSVSYNKIGNILAAQSDSDGALKSYRAGLMIREKLSARDPASAERQFDLVVSYWKLGSAKLGLPAVERQSFLQAGLKRVETLQTRGQLTPSRAGVPALSKKALEDLK
jgi:tetratricopeptide (TPR) repeat protein